MFYYKLTLSFKGTNYLGWQKQKDFSPTVQDELEKALSKVFKSKEIHTVGSGRTDTGVHSLSHVIKAKVPFEIENQGLLKALNSNLPSDIRIHSVQTCEESFRPTNDAVKKEYKYLFTNNSKALPFQVGMMANYPYELDFESMEKACKLFIGKHDFEPFSCVGSDPNSTLREIFECELIRNIEPNLQGILPTYHCVRIQGDGFLKQMVRLIVGSIWHVGRGKLSLQDLENTLKNGSKKRIGEVAPPDGLYKVKTWY